MADGMTDIHERWLEAQRRRWMQPNAERFTRPDAARFMRPDAERYMRPDADRFLQPWALERKRTTQPAEQAGDAISDWEFEAEVRRLRCDLASLKLDLALQRFAAARSYKANFDPNQPRVPAGNSDGGQWTSTGGAGAPRVDGRTRVAGPLPPGIGHNQGPPLEEMPPLPKERPAISKERTGITWEAARRLARFGGPIGRVIGAAIWLYEYDADIEASLDPPRSLVELQQATATPKRGYHKHHIVEQKPAERDGFERDLIDGPDNLVLIPAMKHRQISDWYSKNNANYGGISPREHLRGKSWEERRAFGLQALIDAGVLKP